MLASYANGGGNMIRKMGCGKELSNLNTLKIAQFVM
jgi:hypothetical protein